MRPIGVEQVVTAAPTRVGRLDHRRGPRRLVVAASPASIPPGDVAGGFLDAAGRGGDPDPVARSQGTREDHAHGRTTCPIGPGFQAISQRYPSGSPKYPV
jgi:hypothetical protein